MSQTQGCIAHIREKSGETQSVLEHLTGTAELASVFAAPFGAEEAAYRCGLLHDVGKYSAGFQKRIRGADIQVDHATAGAVEAFALRDAAAAFCIAGHHGGIPDRGGREDGTGAGTLMERVKRRPGKGIEDYSAYRQEVSLPAASQPERLMRSPESAFFYTHMLYSCLVDADWLDTERFMQAGAVQRGTGEPLERLSQKLDRHVAGWWGSQKTLNIRRCDILRSLIDAGARSKGMYTLTVPTGGGKTVSSMAFALRHALHCGHRRIIYVIPYTSIIEQTQRVFEGIFGPENVVAHYANVEYPTDENGQMSGADRLRYLASENWDAPIILTTAVQFFESLFGNHPSRCRKLHNIADSVLIFDEAQMLPVNYLRPCVRGIAELVQNYGCTAVLCTATQPSLGRIIEEFLPGGAEELCPDAKDDDHVFRRVRYQYEGLLTDEVLAARLCEERQALCVVNSRGQAQALYSRLPKEGSYHLSTAMFPAHRRRILEEIRSRLLAGEPCRVVSTSLIEAGVDVDFPSVYRALAGLDSIIQAAGRCNREGKSPAENSIVHIFDTEAAPPRALKPNIAAAKRTIEQYADLAAPQAVEAYFRFLLYTLKDERALDEKDILRSIRDDMAFAGVAKDFRLIDNACTTVYVPLDGGEELTKQLTDEGPTRGLLRKLGQYAVPVYEYSYRMLDDAGAVQKVSKNAAVLLSTDYYDRNTGLALSPEGGKALFDR